MADLLSSNNRKRIRSASNEVPFEVQTKQYINQHVMEKHDVDKLKQIHSKSSYLTVNPTKLSYISNIHVWKPSEKSFFHRQNHSTFVQKCQSTEQQQRRQGDCGQIGANAIDSLGRRRRHTGIGWPTGMCITYKSIFLYRENSTNNFIFLSLRYPKPRFVHAIRAWNHRSSLLSIVSIAIWSCANIAASPVRNAMSHCVRLVCNCCEYGRHFLA